MYENKTLQVVVVVAFMFFLGSCQKSTIDTSASNLYIPVEADATATASLLDLTEGRTLYTNHCGSCHQLYSPDSYSVSQWPSILGSMAPKTNLNSSEVLLVQKYLTRGK